MSYLSRHQRIATDVMRKARLAINQLMKKTKKKTLPDESDSNAFNVETKKAGPGRMVQGE